jgi:predicted porin
MMKKTLVALAAAAAAGAFAQSVTLSGRASMDYSTYAATGSTATGTDLASRARVNDTGSRITFSVSEDLGGGLRAGVYCETGFAMDTASAAGQSTIVSSAATASTSEWCSRDSRLSLGNDTVEFRIGRQNNFWQQGELNSSGSSLIGTDFSSALYNPLGNSFTRFDNTMKLVGGKNLGNFAGSEIYTAIATGIEAAAAGTVPTDRGATTTGITVKFASGQWVSQLDQVTVNTNYSSTTNVSSFDRNSMKFGVGYKYAPSSIVSLTYYTAERKDTSSAANAFSQAFDDSMTTTNTTNTGSAKASGYYVNLNHNLGNGFTAVALYGRANNLQTGSSSTELADSGAVAYSLGGIYRLSKRTHLYGAVHSVKNDSASNLNMTAGGQNSGTITNGATVSITALGLIHNF